MLVKSFLRWMDTAPAHERAYATTVLAEAYLAGTLGEDTPEAVEAALTSVLDDPAPNVRRALAVAFADRREAPRHLVLSLAGDQPDVAAMLIARSPLLTEADLVDLATSSERLALIAIAMRHDVTGSIAHAIARRGEPDAALALVGNGNSEISEADLLALVECLGDRAKFRAAVQARAGLPLTVRHALMLRTADGLGQFVVKGGFLPAPRKTRLLDDTLQAGTVALARQAPRELAGFVDYLRRKAYLTPALLLRSVLGGDQAFLAHALANLCQQPLPRVQTLLQGRSEASISLLLRKAGLPAFVEPVLAAAAMAAARLRPEERRGEFSLPVLRAAQGACLGVTGEEGVRLMAMLRRFEAQTQREESRARAEALREDLRQEEAVPIALSLPEQAEDLLRLGGFDAEGQALVDAVVEATPEFRSPDRRILRQRGLVLDEPIPDLASVIAEWKQEQAWRVTSRPEAANARPERLSGRNAA